MPNKGPARSAAIVLALCGAVSPAYAQNQVIIDRGLTDDLPYTAIYPDVLKTIDDGNSQTILTLQHPNAFLQCDVFAVSGPADGWTAEGALQSLDIAGIEATWAPDCPGFKVTSQNLTNFASGPALLYEGQADSSPMGVPISIVHAEAVDAGRTYAVECLLEQAIAADARPMIDFVIANFSTKSDGQCCINPADDRG
jgi:hypothetical protein